MTAQPVVIWTETPVRDLDAAAAYYAAILKIDVTFREEGGRRVAAVATEGSVGTDLFVDPAAGQGAGVLHMTVTDGLENALLGCLRMVARSIARSSTFRRAALPIPVIPMATASACSRPPDAPR